MSCAAARLSRALSMSFCVANASSKVPWALATALSSCSLASVVAQFVPRGTSLPSGDTLTPPSKARASARALCKYVRTGAAVPMLSSKSFLAALSAARAASAASCVVSGLPATSCAVAIESFKALICSGVAHFTPGATSLPSLLDTTPETAA